MYGNDKLSELQQRIVAELEEAGSENMHTILNTVMDPRNEMEQVREMRVALEGLVEVGFAQIGFEARLGKVEKVFELQDARAFLASFESWFLYDSSHSSWTLAQGDKMKDPFPAIFLTQSGERKAHEILAQRGYHWWAHMK